MAPGANGAALEPVSFAALPGWEADDHAAAWRAFRLSAARIAADPPKTRALGFDGDALSAVARSAMTLPASLDGTAARAFFEQNFQPVEITPESGSAFYTGFYEPEAEASLVPTERHRVPLLRPPPELVEVEDPAEAGALEPGMRFARRTPGGLEPFFERGEIERGALAGRGLEIAYVSDPVDAFFIHIQGAARLKLPDGSWLRITYAAKSGHAYTPIGRVLIEIGALERGHTTMPDIRRWLGTHPEEGMRAMWQNRSYIFFREAAVEDPALGPIAAAKVPLSPGRSLAVDRTLHTFHMPIWIDTALPDAANAPPIRRLMVAQDTGSAILGPARGDIFFGSGDAAGVPAGMMAGRGRFVVLSPRPAGASPS